MGETAIPELVTDDGDWRSAAALLIALGEQAAEQRAVSQDRIVVGGDGAYSCQQWSAIDLDIESVRSTPAADAVEGALPTLEFQKHGIGNDNAGVVAIDPGKLHQLIRMWQGQRPEHERAENGEDGGRRTDAYGKNNHCNG